MDGVRVHEEQELTGAAELRFGNVKMIFRSLARASRDTKSTRGIVGLTDEQLE